MILSRLENGLIVKSACNITDFDYCCNVLCIGAGSSGCYAAASAAREGARVILLEFGENIGGMHVCGNVAGYYYGASGGSYEEDDQKNKEDTVFFANGRQMVDAGDNFQKTLSHCKKLAFCFADYIKIIAFRNCVDEYGRRFSEKIFEKNFEAKTKRFAATNKKH